MVIIATAMDSAFEVIYLPLAIDFGEAVRSRHDFLGTFGFFSARGE